MKLLISLLLLLSVESYANSGGYKYACKPIKNSGPARTNTELYLTEEELEVKVKLRYPNDYVLSYYRSWNYETDPKGFVRYGESHDYFLIPEAMLSGGNELSNGRLGGKIKKGSLYIDKSLDGSYNCVRLKRAH